MFCLCSIERCPSIEHTKFLGQVWLIREGTFFLEGGGLGPQRGGSSVKVSTKRGGPYLM